MSSNESGGSNEQPYNGESSGKNVPTILTSRPTEDRRLGNGTGFTSGKAGIIRSMETMPLGGKTTGTSKSLNPSAREYKWIPRQTSGNAPVSYKTSTNWRENPFAASLANEVEPVQSAILPNTAMLPPTPEKAASTEHQSLSAIPLYYEALPAGVVVSQALETAPMPQKAPSIGATVSEAVTVVPKTHLANGSMVQLYPSTVWHSGPPPGPKYPGSGQSIAMRRQPQPGEICHTIFIPTGKCGLIIGRGGDLITKIQDNTGCRLISCGHASENTHQGLRPVLLVGTPQTVPLAEAEIWKYINDSTDRPSMITYGHIQNQAQQWLPIGYSQASVEEQLYWLFNIMQQLVGFVRDQGQNQLRPVVAAIQGAIEQLKSVDTASQASCDHRKTAVLDLTDEPTNQNPKPWIVVADPRDFTEYETLQYLPGHYMASDKMKNLMKNLDISGRIKTEDFKELVDLLRGTYLPDVDTMNLLEKLKVHTGKYYPSKDAARIFNRFKIPDLYMPTKEECASYASILRKSKEQNVQVGMDDLKLCLKASIQEKERLKDICNDLAQWIQLMQNDTDEITRLKLCIHKLKIENLSKDSDVQLEQIRQQHSKNLEAFDATFEEEVKKRLAPIEKDLEESRSHVNISEQRVADLSSILRSAELEVNCLRSDKANYASNLSCLLKMNINLEEELALADSKNRTARSEIEILRAKIASSAKGAKEAATQTEQSQQGLEKPNEKNMLLEEHLKYTNAQIKSIRQDKQMLEKRNAKLVAELNALKEKMGVVSYHCGGQEKENEKRRVHKS